MCIRVHLCSISLLFSWVLNSNRYLFFLFFLLITTSLPGQESQESEVVVEAKRSAGAASRNSSATVIETPEKGRFQSLDEILEQEAGINVRRYGGLGSYSTLSIRGSNANQVNIFIDGIPLNNAGSGEVNLSDINLDSISSIEMFRSGSPGAFSGSAAGGSINLIPGQPEGAGQRLVFSGGSFGTARAVGQAWGGDKLAWAVSGGMRKSDQDYRFHNDNGTPFVNRTDDFDDKRRNAQIRDNSFTGRANYKTGNTEWKILDDYIYRYHGVPGPGSNQTHDTRREYWRDTLGAGSDTKGFLIKNLRLGTRVFYSEGQESFFDPAQELSSGSPDSHSRIQMYGTHLIPELYLIDYHQIIRFFLGIEREAFHGDRRDRFDDITQKIPAKFRNHSSAHIEDEIFFQDKRIVITPLAKYQKYTDSFNDEYSASTWDPYRSAKSYNEFAAFAVGALFVPFRASWAEFQIRADAASDRRMPNFLELFGERGSIIGNQELRPEKSRTVDAGMGVKFLQRRNPGEIFLTAFDRKVQDMILFVPNSQFSLRPENIDSASIRGAEFTLRLKLLDHIKNYINYTYQNAVNTSDVTYLKGKILPLRPRHEAHGGLSYFNEHLETGTEIAYTGAVFRDRTNDYFNYQPARIIYNVFLMYSVYGRSRRDTEILLGMEVKNILDTRVSDITGYPLPGRSVYVTLSSKF